MPKQFVIFDVLNETYAIDSDNVLSIERILPVTRIPYAHDFVAGVMNLRGDIIPVVDLHKRLNVEQIDDTEASRILVLKYKDYVIGIKVDRVSNVKYFDEEEIEDFDKVSLEDKSQYFDYVIYDGDIMVLIPNIPKLLDIPEE